MTHHNEKQIYDLLIIGGGINGTGIAANASSRGLSVALCEQYDLANATSSSSTKLIHGGLRYLEHYEFALVRKSLAEREVLLNIAPHLVQPIELILPHEKSQRSKWLIRLGLFLYDMLGKHFGKKSTLPHSKRISLKQASRYAAPLRDTLTTGFSYYDCKVDDARLVILNALAAKQHGANIMPRHKLIHAQRQQDYWTCTLENQQSKEQYQLRSKVLINAAGPWVAHVLQTKLHLNSQHQVNLVKGSHIVTRKLYEGDHGYLLQHCDKRVIFVLPYHNDSTMIGTTDIDYHGDPIDAQINAEERIYLCDAVNRYFASTISPADIINEWSGVRPLQADESDDPSAVTRDYFIELDTAGNQPPLLSIFGGKITTYRELAEEAIAKLKPYFKEIPPSQTASTPLPGGDIISVADYLASLVAHYPFIDKDMLSRYAHSYGTLAGNILQHVDNNGDLGFNFGSGLYAKEVDYLINNEWAVSCDDILWRRSKLGLQSVDIDALTAYLENKSITLF